MYQINSYYPQQHTHLLSCSNLMIYQLGKKKKTIYQLVTFIITSKLCMHEAYGLTHKSPVLLLSLHIHAHYYCVLKTKT